MKTGRITAKLRDAVPVCLMVEGEEVQRYKNIELPDALKEIEMRDFHFSVYADGKIAFEIHYEQGALPEVFPEARTRGSRAAKAAAKAGDEPPAAPAQEETALAVLPEAPAEEPEAADLAQADMTAPEESEAEQDGADADEAPGTMEIAFNLSGIRRKELVTAVGGFTGAEPEYKAAPSFAYEVGGYTVDKNGTLTGEHNPALLAALAEQGFTAAE